MSFTNFNVFYTKFQAISRVQGAKINSRLFKVFKEMWEPEEINCYTLTNVTLLGRGEGGWTYPGGSDSKKIESSTSLLQVRIASIPEGTLPNFS